MAAGPLLKRERTKEIRPSNPFACVNCFATLAATMKRPILLSLSLALACAGCSTLRQRSGMIPEWTTNYHRILTEDDRVRLRDWRQTFRTALDAARKSGHGTAIDREGSLLEPDAALAGHPIPNGLYRCRVIKIGAKEPGNLDFVSYPGFDCRVDADQNLQRLAKQNGAQRYVGIVFPGDALHQVFLGTLVLADEQQALQYGQDKLRDVAGYVEAIGANRWRLVMPQPHFESQLDVLELTPMSKERR